MSENAESFIRAVYSVSDEKSNAPCWVYILVSQNTNMLYNTKQQQLIQIQHVQHRIFKEHTNKNLLFIKKNNQRTTFIKN